MNIESLIVNSHPYRPELLTRRVLTEIYGAIWGTDDYESAMNMQGKPHVDYIRDVDCNDAFVECSIPPEIGVVIPTFNRPEYLQQFITTLVASDLSNCAVLLIDDASTDPRTLGLIQELQLGVPLVKIFKTENTNMNVGLDIGWCIFQQMGCRYLCNIDSDALVHPLWLRYLELVFGQLPYDRDNVILSGFNRKQDDSVYEDHAFFRAKRKMGGINYFFTPKLYSELRILMFNSNWDNHIQYFAGYKMSNKLKMICTKPSVVQHIGKTGLNAGSLSEFDEAEDFDLNAKLSFEIN